MENNFFKFTRRPQRLSIVALCLTVKLALSAPPLVGQQAYLKASNTGVEDYFGGSVSVSGNTVVVAAHREDSSTTGSETFPAISADGLSLFFTDWFIGFGVPRSGSFGNGDLWISTRENSQSTWQPANNLGPAVNTSFIEATPAVSSDGLTLIFISDRPGNVPGSGRGRNALDFWITTRTNASDGLGWRPPMHLGESVKSIYADESPNLSRDGLALYFTSNRPSPGRPAGNYDLWVARRESVSEPFGAPESLAAHFADFHPMGDPYLSADGSTLFFNSRGLLSNPAPRGDLWQVPVLRPPPLSISRIVTPAQP